jgi:hypothetical protein
MEHVVKVLTQPAVEAYAACFPANVFLRLVNRARNTGNLVPQTKEVGGVTPGRRNVKY